MIRVVLRRLLDPNHSRHPYLAAVVLNLLLVAVVAAALILLF